MKKLAFIISTALLLMLCVFPCFAVNQGVEGDVIHVAQPEQLEVYLGEEYAGAGFMLELDYGEYPDIIYADENGLLKLEIGGSSKYTLRKVDEYTAGTAGEEVYQGEPTNKTTLKENQTGETQTQLHTENPYEHKPLSKGAIVVIALLVVILLIGVGFAYFKISSPHKYESNEKSEDNLLQTDSEKQDNK